MNKIPMTLQGYEKLKTELEYLKQIRRKEIIKSISEAREHGDLKENAEYHAAREEQGFCEGRIQELENILSNAQIIEVKKFLPNDRVIFGATVSIKNIKNGIIKTYRIVGDNESDCKKNLISINSPMARGLIGKKTNNIVFIKTPIGKIEYKIIKVEYL